MMPRALGSLGDVGTFTDPLGPYGDELLGRNECPACGADDAARTDFPEAGCAGCRAGGLHHDRPVDHDDDEVDVSDFGRPANAVEVSDADRVAAILHLEQAAVELGRAADRLRCTWSGERLSGLAADARRLAVGLEVPF